jgi:hypothetical protein
MDDLQKAYEAYQQALYHLRDPKVGLRVSKSRKLANGN